MAVVKKRRSRVVRVGRSFENFSQGLNTLFSPVLLEDTESSDLQNVRLREKGTVAKRGGTKRLNNGTGLSGGLEGLHALYRKDSTKYLLFKIGTTLYKLDTATGDEVAITTTLTAGKRLRMVTYRDKAYCTDGVDAMFTCDGATTTAVGGTPPLSPILAIFKNHVFAVDSSTPNRSRFSELDNPDSWPALNFIDINSDDGDKLTAYLVTRGRLYMFKERSIWQLLGDSVSNFALDGPRSSYGAVNQEVVQQVGDLILFLSREGVVAFDGAQSLVVSDKITPEVRSFNEAAIERAAAYVFRDEYGLAVPYAGSSANNRVLVWDSLRRAWMRDVGINAALFTHWAPAGVDTLVSGGAALPYLYEHEQDARNDDGQPIDAWYATKVFDFDYDVAKKGKSLYVHLAVGATALMDVEVDRDRSGYELLQSIDTMAQAADWDVADWDVAVWDQSATSKPFRIPYSKKYLYLRVRVRNARLNENFAFYKLSSYFSVKPPIK